MFTFSLFILTAFINCVENEIGLSYLVETNQSCANQQSTRAKKNYSKSEWLLNNAKVHAVKRKNSNEKTRPFDKHANGRLNCVD